MEIYARNQCTFLSLLKCSSKDFNFRIFSGTCSIPQICNINLIGFCFISCIAKYDIPLDFNVPNVSLSVEPDEIGFANNNYKHKFLLFPGFGE
jgi:hypothetical protein